MPRDWIREKWDAGYYITSVGTNGGGKWFFVMSKGASYQQQGYYSGKTFPNDWVKEKWGAGYNITGIR